VAIGSLELYVTVDIWLPCLVDLLGDDVAGTVLLSREDCLVGLDTLLCFLFEGTEKASSSSSLPVSSSSE
jgi:hypothetical protein